MRGGDRGEQGQGELRDVQISLGDERRQLRQDWGEGGQVEAARVVLHQGVQQHKGGELEGTLVLPVCVTFCIVMTKFIQIFEISTSRKKTKLEGSP